MATKVTNPANQDPVLVVESGERPFVVSIDSGDEAVRLSVAVSTPDRTVLLLEKEEDAPGRSAPLRVEVNGCRAGLVVQRHMSARTIAHEIARQLCEAGLDATVKRAFAEELRSDAVLLEIRG